MKYPGICLIIIACSFFAISCTKSGGYLEQTSTTNLDEEAVFSDSARSMDFLNSMYLPIGFSFSLSRFGGAGLDASCDEAEGPPSTFVTTYNQFASGSVSAYSINRDAWTLPYVQIRAANQYLSHLDAGKDPERTDTIPFNFTLKRRTRGEAMFLRAWYYAQLVKHFGGVPLIGDTVYNATDQIKTSRDTYEDCVNYIVAQCDSAYSLLSFSYTGSEFGRVTKGACLGLKARVLLYAASPLFNGGQIATDEPLRSITGYPTFSADRWKRAADAAKDVIDLDRYHLNTDNTTSPGYGFYNVFLLRINNEYIFQKMNGDNIELEGLWRPPSRSGGSTSGSWPYQNLVDDFQMINGLDITDPNSGYDPANPYLNRDPRLDYTVTRNGSLLGINFSSQLLPVYTYVGEPKGDGFGQGTPTGYYGNKMCRNQSTANSLISQTQRCYPLIRYADILLMYAEALNEYSGPSQEVYNAMDSIRNRAGLVPFSLPSGLSQDQMREAIRHERRVELAFEEHRFWDVRRWKIAEATENVVTTGMKITVNATGDYVHTIVPVRDHNFRPAMYLWPIPQTEAAKSPDLLQNPGY